MNGKTELTFLLSDKWKLNIGELSYLDEVQGGRKE